MKKSHHFLGGNFVINCRIATVRSALYLISRLELEKTQLIRRETLNWTLAFFAGNLANSGSDA